MLDKMKLQIAVDTREPSQIISELENLGLEVKVQSLDVGDFSLGSGIFVERKTGQDFVNSLADGRLFEQLQRLGESSPLPILILEDFGMAFLNPEWEKRKKNIFGAISYISTRLFVNIIPTNSIQETAILLERLCSWLQEDKEDPVLITRGVKRSMSLQQKQEYLIHGLPGIGSKTANLLFEQFGTPIGIIKAFLETRVIRTKSGRIKGIEGPLAVVRGIGPKTVLAIKEVLEEKARDY